ncbi:glucose-1-phosphate adenylyltransferase [Endothiovibrio diazotrophicus]
MIDQTLTLLLAGGVGSRLSPLTRERAKPAVPFGGKYRIIDFALSNCLHSGLRRVLVLTQYKSFSLQKHLRDAWSLFNPELGEYITPVPPQMRKGERWYAGTADAVAQNLYLLERADAKHALILSGDHIYRMDYAAMLAFHRERGAAVTVACMEVPLEEAQAFGVIAVDGEQRIVEFQEKPAEPRPSPSDPDKALVSMGIYVFDMALLIRELERDQEAIGSSHDFGKDILPRLIGEYGLYAYPFGGTGGRVSQDRYWRDVGTLDAYYRANMDLLEPMPPLDLYQPEWGIRGYCRTVPPARTVPGASGSEGICINAMVAGGVVIAGGTVQHSILFPHVYVGDEAQVEDSILFEGVRLADRARVRRCIIDKGVEVPAGVSIGYDPQADAERFEVSESGVVAVPKGYRFE